MVMSGIGILGGSFNPPHEGHRALVLHALKRLRLARMRVLVTPQNPLKSAEDYGPLDTRIAQTKDVLHGLPHVQVAPEAELGPVYAVDSVRRLLMREPATPFVYIMGADSFAGLHRWHRWRELMDMVPIAVVSRPGYRLEALNSPAARAYGRAPQPGRRASSIHAQAGPAWVYVGGLEQTESSTDLRSGAAPSPRGMESANV